MSHRASEWGFRLEVPPTERFVAVTLGDRADGEGLCWPSYRDISERTGYTLSTVKRSVKQLMEWGLLEIERRYTVTGRSSSNMYRLRLDRRAPVEVAAETAEKRGVTAPPSPDADEKNPHETGTSQARKGQGCQPATPPEPPDGSGSATHMGPSPGPSNRNRHSEPISPAPKPGAGSKSIQSERKTAKAKTAAPPEPARGQPEGFAEDEIRETREGFRTLVNNWQQANWAAFIGDEKPAWKIWRKLDALRREKAIAKWLLCRNAWRATYAKWVNSPKDNRGRRPKVPSVAEYLRYEIWESVGEPQDVEALRVEQERESASRELCSAIGRRLAPEKVWIREGTDQWNAWAAFFRANRVGLTARKAIFADKHDFGASDGEMGWRFPTPYPPKSEEAHADPPTRSPMRAESDEMADFH